MKDILEINTNRRADFDLIIGVFLAYIYISVTVCLVKHGKTSFYDIYFLIINLLLLSILFFKKGSFSFFKNEFNKSDVIRLSAASILITGLCTYILYTVSEGRDVWLDEYTQFIIDRKISISIFSAYQQQPPLDYFFSSFARITLGDNPFAVKFHAVAFFILTMLSSLYLAYAQSKKIHVAIVYPLAMMTSSVICYQAYEARPVMLSIFTGSLFVFFYFQYLYSKNISLFYVLATQLLFLFSIGLQPMILIASCFVGAVLYERGITEKIKSLFCTHLISALIYSFFLHLIYQRSKEIDRFKGLPIANKVESIKNIELGDFLKYFDHQALFILYFLLPLLLLFFIVDRIRREKNDLLHLVFSLCVFVVFFEIIYITMINFSFAPRYSITISILISFIAFRIMKKADGLINGKRYPSLKLFILPHLLLFTLLRESGQHYAIPSYKKIYDYLMANATSRDTILNFSLSKTGSWRSHIFTSKEIYYGKKEHSNFVHYVHFPEIDDHILINMDKIPAGDIYLIQFEHYTPNDILFHEYQLKNIESIHFHKEGASARIMKIKRSETIKKPFEEYLFNLLKKFKNKNELSLVYETLAIMKINQGDLKAALKIISQYERLEGDHEKTFEGVIYNFQDDLNRRISFLRKMAEKKLANKSQ